MAIMLTDQVCQTQIANGKWLVNGNQLALLDNGKVMYVPRSFKTDNITFISDDFADVRASHFHDLACQYHKMIYTNLTVPQLRKMGYLICYKGKWICNDIPKCYLYIENVTFKQTNDLFKQCLLACYEGKLKSNIMWLAVNFNVGWLFSGKKKITFKNLYKDGVAWNL